MEPPEIVLGLVQMRASEESEENLERAIDGIRRAARDGANVVVLQELFRAPYPCQEENVDLFALAEPIPGPSTDALARVAAEAGVVVVASLFEKRAEGIYHNTAVVLDADGSIRGRYRKMHIPDDPHYYEKFYFTPGDLGFRAFPTRYGSVGTLVCWDQWFPEAARLTALAGAEVLVYPTAIGWLDADEAQRTTQQDAWETSQRAHAIANGVYVAACNRVGREGHINFWGRSFVADPQGRILCRASETEEEILVQPLARARIREVRHGWPFLRDRRLDAYDDLAARFRDD